MEEKIGDKILSPHTIIADGDGYMIVEFKTFYRYLLYFIIAGLSTGLSLQIYKLKVASLCFLILYLFIITPFNLSMRRKISRALKEKSVEFSGNCWSFSNPLKARIEKKFL